MIRLFISEKMVKENGYLNKRHILYDYGFIPTRLIVPNHKKIEIIGLILKSIINYNNTKRS